jgi:hypothetical protein
LIEEIRLGRKRKVIRRIFSLMPLKYYYFIIQKIRFTKAKGKAKSDAEH